MNITYYETVLIFHCKILQKREVIKVKESLKELMQEVNLEEMEQLQGAGFSAAQCAWMAISCLNYIPGVGKGCGGNSACQLYKKYCK